MNFKLFWLRFLILFSTIILCSSRLFLKHYEQADILTMEVILQTEDKGFIIAGNKNMSKTDNDIWVLKLDKNGVLIWERIFNGKFYKYIYSIEQTEDNGYILVGMIKLNKSGNTNNDILVMKLDRDGKMIWQKTFGSRDHDLAYVIKQTSDKGYIIIGSSYRNNKYQPDAWIIKLNAVGDKQWDIFYGAQDQLEIGRSIIEIAPNEYIAAIYKSNNEMDIIKINKHHKIIKKKNYKKIGDVFSLVKIGYDSFVVSGYYTYYITCRNMIMKLDNDLNFIWEDKLYDGIYSSLDGTKYQGCILVGRNEDCIIVKKLTKDGKILWSKQFDVNKTIYEISIKQTYDEGFVIAATVLENNDYYKVLVFKLDKNGLAENCFYDTGDVYRIR